MQLHRDWIRFVANTVGVGRNLIGFYTYLADERILWTFETVRIHSTSLKVSALNLLKLMFNVFVQEKIATAPGISAINTYLQMYVLSRCTRTVTTKFWKAGFVFVFHCKDPVYAPCA